MSEHSAPPRSLFEKLWDSHVIATREDGASLVWVDRHYLQEGSFHAFNKMRDKGETVARPDLTVGIADHYVPTRGRSVPIHRLDPKGEFTRIMDQFAANAGAYGIRHYGMNHPWQGICHVVGPELGLTLPGTLVVEGDSHTSTHGALGAWAFGVGASEVAHVLMTQTLWQKPPKRLRVTVDGELAQGVTAKDLVLTIVARLGADGAAGHVIEYAGSAVRALSVEGRLTLCNMSIECGARCGMVAPDATTLDYVRGRPFAPQGMAFDRAAEAWLKLTSDTDAAFDREVHLRASDIVPTVTWGTTPEDALPVTSTVPDPASMADTSKAKHVRDALDYMGLRPGMHIRDIAIDRVFIGSCTNSRIEDLRAAAAVLAGRRARVPGLVSPGSTLVKTQAEQEGLDRIFSAAGLEWAGSGCSMCVAMNGDALAEGERCASTTNRNFKGRQGRGSRTHLMSPAMVAAAAVAGHLVDVRELNMEGA
ncbi:3-isopropylmalate dehydratase large subunit [Pseudorhodoferax sp. Leaf265]|uniref:3-isopropylmalate dehydratase large subunit n=1 Tax=Pseudorhodoferax sp. Leaf265 TaxID=1736315 RepID=UPI0006F1F0BC|nr:3-isopropylmalate dehydratase large subunit [Pseudorhodoferax sp. Leaf265]KQP15985.1 isopropylmalate isomerase [Pseudorhodoferax sp. Leaf265]